MLCTSKMIIPRFGSAPERILKMVSAASTLVQGRLKASLAPPREIALFGLLETTVRGSSWQQAMDSGASTRPVMSSAGQTVCRTTLHFSTTHHLLIYSPPQLSGRATLSG